MYFLKQECKMLLMSFAGWTMHDYVLFSLDFFSLSERLQFREIFGEFSNVWETVLGNKFARGWLCLRYEFIFQRRFAG
jgi:hypothetical protein